MKKALIVLTSIVLICVMLFTGCGKKETHGIADYQVKMDYKDGFKIMVISDVHICALTNMRDQETYLKHIVGEAKPDLIVVNGDSFFDATKKEVTELFEIFDSFNIKWAYLKGNHDHQGEFSHLYVDGELAKMKNAINVDYNDDLKGEANFYVDLKKGDDLVYRLFMIDSGSYKRANVMKYTYDEIDDGQLSHVEAIQKAETDTEYTTLAFFHIPLNEFADAYEGYKNGTYKGRGENREDSCPSLYNHDQFSRLKAAGVRAMFCSHDHINSSTIDYKDVIFNYCVKSSDQIYSDEDMIGYTLVTLNDAPFTMDNIQNIFVNFEDVVQEVK